MLKYKLTPVYADNPDKETPPTIMNNLKIFPTKEIKQSFSKIYANKLNKWIKNLKKGFNKKFYIEKNSLKIIYKENNVIGSSVVDLLKFFIIPKINERPIDIKQFYLLCVEKLTVPKFLLKKYSTKDTTSVKVMWKQL